MYQLQIDYTNDLKSLDLNGKVSTHSVPFGEYRYYYVDVVDDMYVYININSLSDGITGPFVYISRSNRHPSGNDTFCKDEMELNKSNSVCTMRHIDESSDSFRFTLIYKL